MGEERGDLRMAIFCSHVTNIARTVWGKKGVEMTTPKDFLPNFDKDDPALKPKEQSVDEQKTILQLIASVFSKGKKK